MRTLAAIWVLAAGCGRIGFESHVDPTGDGARDQVGPSADADLAPLLVGCQLGLAMNEASWTAGLVDRCGGDNIGVPTGGATPVDDPQRGRVGEFVGGTSCVIVPDAPELRGGSAVTVSSWVRPTQLTPASFGVVSKRTDFTIDTAYSVFVWADMAGAGTVNHVYVDIDTENDRFENPGDEFLNAWKQITIVYDGSRTQAERIAVYVDGGFRTYGPETSSSIPTPTTPPDVYVGCLPLGGPAQSLVGRLDDVMIWSRALPAADVAAWYAATK